MWLGALLPLGVVAQAVLGGFTVKGALDYGWVMGHFALSMLILVAALLLVWRARQEAQAAPRGGGGGRRRPGGGGAAAGWGEPPGRGAGVRRGERRDGRSHVGPRAARVGGA